MIKLFIALVLGLLFVVSGCRLTGLKLKNERKLLNEKELILATTTSVYDSGLLEDLISRFERKFGYRVKIIAVGSGESLKMGERGDADLLLVHSPEEEENFMNRGFGKDRRLLMVNYFFLLGPPTDPARVRGFPIVDAFKKIAREQKTFVSRGDNSGTHKKELEIWQKALVKPRGGWYLVSGQGMGESLKIASEKQAYILSDNGTYLALKDRLELKIVSNKEEGLLNQYHLITINPVKFPKVNYKGARKLMNFLLSEEIKAYISRFGRKKYGQPLFEPVDEASDSVQSGGR